MIIKHCKNCGKEFETLIKSKEYCCRKCQYTFFDRECLYCHKIFKGSKSRKYCSKECKQADMPNKLERTKKTNLKKYGVENPFQNELIKEKIKQTNLKKYGVENPSQNKEIYEKIKQTNVEKYGFTSPIKNKDVKNKIENTMIKKYGVKNATQSKKIQNKIKKTNLKKYGVENPFQNELIKEKIKQTNLKKYGTEKPFQSVLVQDKIKKVFKNKYGVNHPSQLNFVKNKIKQTHLERYGVENIKYINIKHFENLNTEYIINNFIKDDTFLLKECCDYFNVSTTYVNKFKRDNGINIPNKIELCKTQQQIYEFIKSFYKGIINFNDRSILNKLELDIYIPDKKLAIEYDGLLYHSYGKSEHIMFDNYLEEDKYYHVRKTDLCEEQGIKLFHVFENEWLDPVKREIWKSKIKLELGYVDRRLNARSCIITTVNSQELKEFLELNHFQSYVSSSINLGLYYKDELVEVMTFGKSRFNKNFDYELLRNCTKINTVVRGGFFKLLSYFKKNYEGSIISYGNRRWTSRLKNVYNGELINISEPNYFYLLKEDFCKLMSRQQFQKYKLSNVLEIFDNNLTETENMYNNNYRKIYDCGNLVYKLK